MRELLVATGCWLLPLAVALGSASDENQIPRVGEAERVEVNLVLIDVVVRDRKERSVSGLSREDFELLVDRRPVDASEIETFEELCQAADPAVSPEDRVAGQPQSSQASVEETRGGESHPVPRYIVIYLDFSQMSLAGRALSLRAAREFLLTGITPRDLVMIVTHKMGLRLVQDFTSSGSLLVSRIDELLADRATLDMDVLEEPARIADVALRPCEPNFVSCTARRALATAYSVDEEQRARRSLRSLEGLMPALAARNGRKALVLFTDALRAEPGAQFMSLVQSTAKAAGIDLKKELLLLTREANAAGVSIYTVHAGGLDDVSVTRFRDARAETPLRSEIPRELQQRAALRDARAETPIFGASAISPISEALDAALTGLDSALAMQTTLATETGGRAIQRTNDLGRILESARGDLSCYYLLGYRYNGRGDGERHSLIVRLGPDRDGRRRPGHSIRHRPYFTDSSETDRLRRRLRSALQAPALYRPLSATTEAILLASQASANLVSIRVSVPVDSLPLTPPWEGPSEGRAILQVVSQDSDFSCRSERELDVREEPQRHILLETECALMPGRYELSVAMIDPSSGEIRARRSSLVVREGQSREPQ